jgi:hypothetical protein
VVNQVAENGGCRRMTHSSILSETRRVIVLIDPD